MTILIVDDEQAVRTGLQNMLELLFPGEFDFEEATGVQSGLQKIQTLRPDLVFLDIQMQDGTGLDLMTEVPNKSFELIFLTAYSDYAMDAFEHRATNYLLKPLNSKKLRIAVEQALENLKKEAELNYHNLQHALTGKRSERFPVPTLEGIEYVPNEKIVCVIADGNYFQIHLTDQKEPILVSKSLGYFEKRVQSKAFIRVHRSYIVNLNEVSSYLKSNRGFIRMTNGLEIPLSPQYKTVFLDEMENL